MRKACIALTLFASTFACGGTELDGLEGEALDYVAGSGPIDMPAPPPCSNLSRYAVPKPDLIPLSVDQIHFHGVSRLRVKIKNQGCAAASAMENAIRLTGAIFDPPIYLSLAPEWYPPSGSIAAQQTATFVAPFSGAATFWHVQVDMSEDVDESNEDNNEASFEMPVPGSNRIESTDSP